mgnify:CR=1 FL=1
MKKLLIVLALFASVSFSMFAQENSGETKEGWSDMTYYSVPILRVLESKEAYVVLYQKNHTGVGSTIIPKDWAYGTPDAPRKLKFRKLSPGVLKPYLTVVKKSGEFHRVIMTVPVSKSHEVWDMFNQNLSESELSKDSLDDLPL